MAVTIFHAGGSWTLADDYSGPDVETIIRDVLRVQQPKPEGIGSKFPRPIWDDGRPFVGFRLATGGVLSLQVHSGLNIAIVDTNGTDANDIPDAS